MRATHEMLSTRIRNAAAGLGGLSSDGSAETVCVEARMRHRWMGLIALVLVLACAPGCPRTPDYSQDRADIEQVFNKYLQTLKTSDVAQASQVWLHSPDVLV